MLEAFPRFIRTVEVYLNAENAKPLDGSQLAAEIANFPDPGCAGSGIEPRESTPI